MLAPYSSFDVSLKITYLPLFRILQNKMVLKSFLKFSNFGGERDQGSRQPLYMGWEGHTVVPSKHESCTRRAKKPRSNAMKETRETQTLVAMDNRLAVPL